MLHHYLRWGESSGQMRQKKKTYSWHGVRSVLVIKLIRSATVTGDGEQSSLKPPSSVQWIWSRLGRWDKRKDDNCENGGSLKNIQEDHLFFFFFLIANGWRLSTQINSPLFFSDRASSYMIFKLPPMSLSPSRSSDKQLMVHSFVVCFSRNHYCTVTHKDQCMDQEQEQEIAV